MDIHVHIHDDRETKDDVKALVKEMKNLTRVASDMRDTVDQLHTKVNIMADQNARIQEAVGELRSEVDALTTRVADYMDSKLSALQAEIENLKGQVAEGVDSSEADALLADLASATETLRQIGTTEELPPAPVEEDGTGEMPVEDGE